MRQYLAVRLAMATFVAWIVSVLVFVLLNVIPGDPAAAILGPNATEEQTALLRETLGLNDPLLVRYTKWIAGVLHGDLGRSLVSRIPVTELLKERLPATVELGVLSLALALAIALPVGIYSAVRPNSAIDGLATFAAIGVAATPTFWFGILLILTLAVWLDALPVSGYVPLTEDPLGNLRHMVMPVLTLGTHSSVLVMRQVRSSLLEVLHQDYIRTSRAKGLPERAVVLRHGLRNALIPVVTVFGFQVGVIVSGAVVVETVFGIPGMGRLLVDSILLHRDFPVVQSTTLLLAVVVVVMNLLVDLTYGLIDPRIRVRR